MKNQLPKTSLLTSKINQIIAFIFLFASLSLLLFAFPARAQEPSALRTMTIVPPSVNLSLAPGETAEGTLKMINDSDETLNFETFIRDYIVEDNQGTPVILPPDTLSNKYSAAAWLGVSPAYFSVPPRKTQELRYFIQVPQDARPGGHYSAVMYQPSNLLGVTGTGAGVFTHIGTLFYIQVEGDIEENASVIKMDGGGFSEYGPVSIATEIQNLGDLHIKPVGSLTIKNLFGQVVARQELETHNIFPERSFLYANSFGEKWTVGYYTAEFEGTYGVTNNLKLAAKTSFVVFPWKVATIALLVIIIIILLIIALRKRKSRTETGEEKIYPAPHEQLS